uniref:Ig-like domain-containing protein n=1 Tax=Actinotalea sp. TaxID=1872145 RepID=UPI0035624D77
LSLSGRGVSSGGWTSLVAPFDLVATSPRLDDSAATGASPSVIASGDLRYVGFTSTAPQLVAAGSDPATAGSGSVGIGIAVDGEWSSLGTNTIPVIDTDIDGDGTPDLETIIWKYSADMDFTTVETYEIVESGGGLALGALLDLSPVNGLWADLDTSVFDSNVVVAPITLDAVGITQGDTPTFQVYTVSTYASDPSGVLDAVPPFTVDPFAPTTWFDGGVADALWYLDADGVELTVHRAEGAGDGSLLLLHTHNGAASRAEVVEVSATRAATTTTELSVAGATTETGTQTLTASVAPAEATGSVRFLDGSTELGTAPVEGGTATLEASLGVGEHSLSAEYLPASAAFLASTSAAVTWSVTARATSTTRAWAPAVISSRATPWVTVMVRSTSRPTGTVTVSEGGTVLADTRIVPLGTTGVAVVRLPRLSAGVHHLTVQYEGSTTVAPSSTSVDLQVVAFGRH